MNNEKNAELGTKIAQILDQSASNVGSRTEKRLLDIRKLALTNYKQQPMPAWALVSANNGRLGQLLAPLGYKASFWTAWSVTASPPPAARPARTPTAFAQTPRGPLPLLIPAAEQV